jgi:hypothetical protein
MKNLKLQYTLSLTLCNECKRIEIPRHLICLAPTNTTISKEQYIISTNYHSTKFINFNILHLI